MSFVIMSSLTSSVLDMFRTLIHPSSGACDFSVESPHWSCGDTIEKSQAPDDGCINVRNMLSIEEVSLLHGYHPNPATLKLQHTSKQEHTTDVVIQ